ncbi:unnamed protein product [Blepharisma stoltei]|uniref:Uncharacterized protein n=1 Tax=Blepharisma stoltei TaxID=1481888 RepID=A0AAU9IIT6_9CILI|nr:unnamed protein product [Blepharisma stoltei]
MGWQAHLSGLGRIHPNTSNLCKVPHSVPPKELRAQPGDILQLWSTCSGSADHSFYRLSKPFLVYLNYFNKVISWYICQKLLLTFYIIRKKKFVRLFI